MMTYMRHPRQIMCYLRSFLDLSIYWHVALAFLPSRYSLAFSADGRWLFSMCAEERKGSKGRNELSATTSPLCAWRLGRLDDARVKAGITGQPRSPHLRLAMKEKVRLVPHPEDWQPADVSAGKAYGTCPAFAILCASLRTYYIYVIIWYNSWWNDCIK